MVLDDFLLINCLNNESFYKCMNVVSFSLICRIKLIRWYPTIWVAAFVYVKTSQILLLENVILKSSLFPGTWFRDLEDKVTHLTKIRLPPGQDLLWCHHLRLNIILKPAGLSGVFLCSNNTSSMSFLYRVEKVMFKTQTVVYKVNF